LLFSDPDCGQHWRYYGIRRMNNAGLGTGFGFSPTTNSDVIVNEYFLTFDDGDNFITEANEFLVIADYSDN